MASTRNTYVVKWSSASTVTHSTNNGWQWSDAVDINTNLSVESWDLDVQVKCNNAGTLTSGDYVDVYISFSPDNTTYDSQGSGTGTVVGSSQFLCRLDTYTDGNANTVMSVPIRSAQRYFKIGTRGGAAVATRNLIVSAIVADHRPQ
jgi:hypothetical protein